MKPNTYTQLYVQIVFAVKNRDAALERINRPKIFEYMSGIIKGLKHKSIIINGVSNHVHIFYGMNPSVSVSDTVHDLKRSSALFINQNHLSMGKFSWQDGYGGFSYSRSQIQSVYHYIEKQEEHHRKRTFQEEYIDFLKKFQIEYNVNYLFDFFEIR